MKNFSFQPVISYFDQSWPLDWGKEFQNNNPIWVEIGFGLGEVLIELSSQSPSKNFIGLEQHEERILRTLQSIERKGGRTNVRLLNVDAKQAFAYLFSQQSIEKVFSLFPCPWSKRGHTKHRLFNESFLRLVNSRLVLNGTLQIVTDSKDYFDWIIPQASETGFDVEEKVIAAKFNTKFERKWQRRGQQEFYELALIKKRHCDIEVLEPSVMKFYSVKQFKPQQFKFQNIKGPLSVIFKDMLFDSDQQRALVHLVVSEEHLSQHVWVEIIYKQKDWLIREASGQHFFRTPGIQKALEQVYESILSSTA